MGEVGGGEAEGYYRRYTLPQLVKMGFADSIEDAEANEAQWKRIGGKLSDAADSLRKIMTKLPDHYQSAEGAPALLRRLGEATKKMQSYGQIALDNGTAWQGVKQSLQKAQGELAVLGTVGQAGLGEAARNEAADAIQRLSSEYINHANDILGPDGRSPEDYDTRPDNGRDDTGRKTIQAPEGSSGRSGGAPGGLNLGTSSGMPIGGVPTSWSPGDGSPPASSPSAPSTRPDAGGKPKAPTAKTGGAPGIIGGSGGGPRAGAGFGPVGRTIGGKPVTAGGPGGSGGPLAGEQAPGRLPGRPGTPGSAPLGPGTAADPQGGGGRPAGGVPPAAPHGGAPAQGGGGRDQRRPGRRRGAPLGDPDDFRFNPEFVAPPVIEPGAERLVEDFGSTIGGKQVSADPWSAPAAESPRTREQAPRSSPLPDGEIRMEGHNVSFKRRPRGGA